MEEFSTWGIQNHPQTQEGYGILECGAEIMWKVGIQNHPQKQEGYGILECGAEIMWKGSLMTLPTRDDDLNDQKLGKDWKHEQQCVAWRWNKHGKRRGKP
ncbi:hypothetical protein VNO77_17269 [Canavalia gladiata]|uniref:Uncharacterized protein n=1 Tax=Canavalia gladiata TaxID=3824 RepID=A0AAN9QMJ6_CANGL